MIDQEHLYKEHTSKDDDRKDYTIYHVKANEIEGCNFDCMVTIPVNLKNNARIVVKTHNTGSPSQNESQSIEENMQRAEGPIDGSYQYIKDENAILIVPLIIQKSSGEYYQHLTRGALLDRTPGYERVDIQIINAINSIKNELLNEDGIQTEKKIDLVGFSAAGGFAQRFMLLHPEIVRAVYAGGAMDGIPLPIDELNGRILHYPLGIADYEEITGHKFNMEAFRQIAIRFSYGEKEREVLNNHYFDEEGNPVSNFDMSYIRSITPEEDGIIMREVIGKTPEERFKKTIKIYKSLGIDIETEIYTDLGHSESKNSKEAVRTFFKRVDEKEKKQLAIKSESKYQTTEEEIYRGIGHKGIFNSKMNPWVEL